jgi:DNA-binding transcriptional LysR family regulator
LIDVQRLAVFREVALAGSFAGAASALHHTPSAVSQQIAALERGVGVALVERSTRGVVLTDAGHLLLATADAIHAELRAAEQRLQTFATDGPQSLTVVTFPSAGEALLAPALTALTSAVPLPLDIAVIEAEPEEALATLRRGEADLALVYHFHTAQPPRQWRDAGGSGGYRPLMADPLRLLVPLGHALAAHPTVDIVEFAEERWIQGWGEPGSVLDALAATTGFRPRIACRCSNYRFMSALVAAGVGVALVPRLALADHPGVRDLTVTTGPTRFVGAYVPQRHWRNTTVERLLAALDHCAAGRSDTGDHLKVDDPQP